MNLDSQRLCELCGNPAKNWSTKTVCKICYNKRWHKEHPDTRGPERHFAPALRFKYGRRAAKQREIEWNISFEEYAPFLDLPCHYCCGQLGSQIHSGVGLDRINNNQDYQLGNILPCCKVCNLIRNTYLSVEETKIAVEAIIAYRKSRVAL